jgi:hypothetical protein
MEKLSTQFLSCSLRLKSSSSSSSSLLLLLLLLHPKTDMGAGSSDIVITGCFPELQMQKKHPRKHDKTRASF